jgi:hypothetical protein
MDQTLWRRWRCTMCDSIFPILENYIIIDATDVDNMMIILEK